MTLYYKLPCARWLSLELGDQIIATTHSEEDLDRGRICGAGVQVDPEDRERSLIDICSSTNIKFLYKSKFFANSLHSASHL